ncbi:hypothetical protein [Klebsiella sp. CN_Kp109]|uniref:hypothetical protein n=1 Tax=Klebsiella sp. CN_Kp109 TaxID=3153427 RepID=UPI0032B5E7FC
MADNEKLGSTSPQILLKNATNLDKLVNGRESESLPDRFAVLRRTWYGMEMIFNRFITYITGRGEQAVGAIGWQELGNWATGLTVDNRQQIVYYNGSWYKYLGELEHVITGDSPENDGGVWSAENPTGKWSNIGDAALRSNLDSDELGVASVNYIHVFNVPTRPFAYYLSKNSGNVMLAIKEAAASGESVIFEAGQTYDISQNDIPFAKRTEFNGPDGGYVNFNITNPVGTYGTFDLRISNELSGGFYNRFRNLRFRYGLTPQQ